MSSPAGAAPATRPPPPRARALDAFLRWREASILVVAVLLAAGFELMNRDFLLSGASLENLSQFVAPTAIIAAGEIMLMIGGEIDLSAGSIFALAPFVLSYSHAAGLPLPLALLLALGASAAIGLANGAVTLLLGVPSFVATLGTMFLLNGVALTWSRGTPATPPDAPAFAAVFGNWGYSEVLWALAVTAGMHVLLRQTRWGLHTVASGGNPHGAAEAGIRVARLKIGNFVLSAVLSGFTGILEGFRISSFDPQAGGSQAMFLAVAAGVIGGTSLAGGSGTVLGGLLGATVLALLNDGFTLVGVNAFTFNIILGGAILLAMVFNIHMTRLRRTGHA